jgi:pimeloyl-ACP methyl ester carboxylesterase
MNNTDPDHPDSATEHDRLVGVRGVDLHCRDAGEGFPMLWSHGLTSCMAHEDQAGLFDWSSVTVANRLVRYDARGHGLSFGSDDFVDYEWANLALDMIGLADQLDIGDFVAGGASMGAATALWAAISAPERVKGMVLVIPPTAWDTRVRQARIYELASTAAHFKLTVPFMLAARYVPVIAPEGTRKALVRSGARFASMLESEQLSVILKGASASGMPLPERLCDIDVPTLILAWRGDRVHPVTTAEVLHAGLPQSQLHVADDDEDLLSWPELSAQFMTRFAL